MSRFALVGLLACGAATAGAAPVAAGMPSVTLTDAASMRLQSISFFLLLFLVVSLIVRAIWNSLRSDFPRLPRLSYPKALGLVGLWGLLFLLVLTMISGARELMTPGAWKKDGITYSLDDGKPLATPAPSAEPTEQARREKLESLFVGLAAYSVRHEGHYPATMDEPTIPAERWKTPHASGMRYIYRSGCTCDDIGGVLACEPELFGDVRFVLCVNGDIKRMTTAELAPLLAAEPK